MNDDPPERAGGRQTRDDRLRAALRANLQRRKAQARARADRPDGNDNAGEGRAGENTGADRAGGDDS